MRSNNYFCQNKKARCQSSNPKSTNTMNQPYAKSILLLLSALLSVSITAYGQTDASKRETKPSTIIVVKDYLGKERILLDSDHDGWDDLWCNIYRNLKHRNKSIDTDGDGLTDYEEMVMGRDPYVKGPLPHEPTPEEIKAAELREEQRKILAIEEAKRLWPERHAKLEEHLQQTFEAGKDAADPEHIRHDTAAVRAKLIARRDKAVVDQAQVEANLDAIPLKHGVEREGGNGTLVGESGQGPIFMSPQDALAANSIFADDFGLPVYIPFRIRVYRVISLVLASGPPSGRRLLRTARPASLPPTENSTAGGQCRSIAALPVIMAPPWPMSWSAEGFWMCSEDLRITASSFVAWLTQVSWMATISLISFKKQSMPRWTARASPIIPTA